MRYLVTGLFPLEIDHAHCIIKNKNTVLCISETATQWQFIQLLVINNFDSIHSHVSLQTYSMFSKLFLLLLTITSNFLKWI